MGLAFGPLRSLAARFHPELAGATVQSWNVRSLFWEARLRQTTSFLWPLTSRRAQCSAGQGPYLGFLEVGRRFAVRVREALKAEMAKAESRKQKGDWIFFGYDTGALEAMEWCRDHGAKCVLGQMDPNRVEVETVREEEKRWSGWALHPIEVPEEYFRRREQEWALADRVVVNSEFCRQALVKQGVPSEKLFVMPLCYEVEDQRAEVRSQKSEVSTPASDLRPLTSAPMRVLWLGQVILRKGIQYLLTAARQLEGENVQFDVVGPLGISREAVASAPPNVTFHGRAARDQAANWYRQCDVFVLPTLSDGFAITQLEAMAYGLPVVTTPCCGDVVSEGVDGFIIPPRDADAVARTLQRYVTEPALLKTQQTAALVKAKQFTLARLARNLESLEAELTKT